MGFTAFSIQSLLTLLLTRGTSAQRSYHFRDITFGNFHPGESTVPQHAKRNRSKSAVLEDPVYNQLMETIHPRDVTVYFESVIMRVPLNVGLQVYEEGIHCYLNLTEVAITGVNVEAISLITEEDGATVKMLSPKIQAQIQIEASKCGLLFNHHAHLNVTTVFSKDTHAKFLLHVWNEIRNTVEMPGGFWVANCNMKFDLDDIVIRGKWYFLHWGPVRRVIKYTINSMVQRYVNCEALSDFMDHVSFGFLQKVFLEVLPKKPSPSDIKVPKGLKHPTSIGNGGLLRWVSSFSDNIFGAKQLNLWIGRFLGKNCSAPFLEYKNKVGPVLYAGTPICSKTEPTMLVHGFSIDTDGLYCCANCDLPERCSHDVIDSCTTSKAEELPGKIFWRPDSNNTLSYDVRSNTWVIAVGRPPLGRRSSWTKVLAKSEPTTLEKDPDGAAWGEGRNVTRQKADLACSAGTLIYDDEKHHHMTPATSWQNQVMQFVMDKCYYLVPSVTLPLSGPVSLQQVVRDDIFANVTLPKAIGAHSWDQLFDQVLGPRALNDVGIELELVDLFLDGVDDLFSMADPSGMPFNGAFRLDKIYAQQHSIGVSLRLAKAMVQMRMKLKLFAKNVTGWPTNEITFSLKANITDIAATAIFAFILDQKRYDHLWEKDQGWKANCIMSALAPLNDTMWHNGVKNMSAKGEDLAKFRWLRLDLDIVSLHLQPMVKGKDSMLSLVSSIIDVLTYVMTLKRNDAVSGFLTAKMEELLSKKIRDHMRTIPSLTESTELCALEVDKNDAWISDWWSWRFLHAAGVFFMVAIFTFIIGCASSDHAGLQRQRWRRHLLQALNADGENREDTIARNVYRKDMQFWCWFGFNDCLCVDEHVPLFWTLSFLWLVLTDLALFAVSNCSYLADLFIELRAGEEKIALPSVIKFSLGWSADQMFKLPKCEWLGVLLILFSGVWPYLKGVMMLTCWIMPPSCLPVRVRGRMIRFLDSFGKWSLVDIFVLQTMVIGLYTSKPIGNPVDGVFLSIKVNPRGGFLAFLIAVVFQMILGHLLAHFHERSSEARSLMDQDMRSKAPRQARRLANIAFQTRRWARKWTGLDRIRQLGDAGQGNTFGASTTNRLIECNHRSSLLGSRHRASSTEYYPRSHFPDDREEIDNADSELPTINEQDTSMKRSRVLTGQSIQSSHSTRAFHHRDAQTLSSKLKPKVKFSNDNWRSMSRRLAPLRVAQKANCFVRAKGTSIRRHFLRSPVATTAPILPPNLRKNTDSVFLRGAVTWLLVTAIVLTVVGSLLDCFSFDIRGLARMVLQHISDTDKRTESTYSLMSLGFAFREALDDPDSVQSFIIRVTYFLFSFLTGLFYGIILLCLWHLNLKPHTKRTVLTLGHIFSAWNSLDIFCASVFLVCFELGEANFIPCSSLAPLINHFHADPGSFATCFRVRATLHIGAYLLAAAAIIYMVVGPFVLHRVAAVAFVCHKMTQETETRRSVTMLSESGCAPHFVDDFNEEEQAALRQAMGNLSSTAGELCGTGTSESLSVGASLAVASRATEVSRQCSSDAKTLRALSSKSDLSDPDPEMPAMFTPTSASHDPPDLDPDPEMQPEEHKHFDGRRRRKH